MKIFLAHSTDFDFKTKLYEPLRKSGHEFIFPHDGEASLTKEMIKSADLFMIDVSQPSTGAGIEAGWADAFGVPVVAIYQKGNKPSNSIKFIAREVIAYVDGKDLLAKLTAII